MSKYLLWLLLILLVLFRQISTRPVYNDGDRVRITTRVSSEPVRYEYSQRLSQEGLIIYLPKYPEITYGDTIIIEGVVDLPAGRQGELKNPVLIEKDESVSLLYRLRSRLLKVYQENLSGEHAALVSGVTLGSKGDISTEFWDKLKVTGTAHVVVASGFNVALVANFLINALIIFFPRRKAVFLAISGIWFYSILSGFDAPIVRAAIMGTIAFSAVALGRLSYAWRGLFLSVFLMLIVRPDWFSDLGFILSFVATASLMLFERRIYKRVGFLPKIVREDFSTSLAAQIGVAPILFVSFGQFNLLSPIINALILWTIAPMTIIGMVGGIIGLFIPFFGRLILFVTYPLTSWFITIVQLFGQS